LKTTSIPWHRVRTPLLVLAGVRAALGIIAIPLAPFLYREHYVVLVLLRPTKDVLLFGGFLIRDGRVGLLPVLLASVPLAVGGVWHFYALGRAFAPELEDGKSLPRWARRVLPPKRIRAMRALLDENRRVVILLGRISVFPSSVLAAAAGAADLSAGEFLPLDAIGAVLSIAEVLGMGYVLGSAYESGSRAVTVIGVVALVGGLVALGRWVRARGA
jgi:membrane protein DedA with SNARE-associated domain